VHLNLKVKQEQQQALLGKINSLMTNFSSSLEEPQITLLQKDMDDIPQISFLQKEKNIGHVAVKEEEEEGELKVEKPDLFDNEEIGQNLRKKQRTRLDPEE
jgi:hypothetical protein